MKLIRMSACVLVLVALFGCSDKPPVSIALGQNQFWNSPQLTITALDENVTVEAIKINRGNCPANSHKKLPYEITFGNSLIVDATVACDKVIETEITTNKGNFTFTW